jgi:predicted DNA-binding protein YlxM (UPF0122 family)
LEEISEDNGVDKKVILDFLREGSCNCLKYKEKKKLLLTCERCGKPITTGSFVMIVKKKLALFFLLMKLNRLPLSQFLF